ncbi:MAG: ABC transporter permease [Bdellovibrionota bacterium]|nr:ABC transporter permease [Bdellovibrionota bacterium]
MKKSLSKNFLFIAGLSIISFMLVMALFAPVLSPFSPYDIQLENRFLSPNAVNWFGTDENGSDIFSKVLFGARISLMVALCVVGINCLVGLVIGSIAGYYGKWVDSTIMRIIDMLQAFPGFLLALSMVAVLGPSIRNLILAMCISGWTAFARLVRGEVLHLKHKEYVQAAVALGAKTPRVVLLHVWPNLTGPLIVQASFAMAGTIIAESSLSFLGLGAPPTEPTWGSLLNMGRKVLIDAPHISIFPGLCIVLLVLGFNFLGDGVRDYLDPKKH